MIISEILEKYSKNTSSTVCVAIYQSPIGQIIAVGDEDYIYIICFEDSKNINKMFKTVSDNLCCMFKEEKNKLLLKFENDLNNYFAGKLKKFNIEIKTFGSDFQKDVWNMLQKQPYGTTQTYGDLAKALGRSGSHARAIGAACGANAHLIVVPCHRIIASNSKGGFSCGLDRKQWLLQHEETHK